ncbi:diphosphomevalonate decarboxylase [Bacteriovorax sp. Seq25_V]|uniref:diphosphomevalonate decarboxylase n=1 Tax=Bacteriovorax sp. Seq25_V TaxID=1201288 RepID=UPI00038A4D1E|nr:diphosphomevalonate decarboxylase [Bacteriovorax sp. Seq25_V]EQC44903.1 diphosphomevalonate decarboxylase [Bacteriovorax sp. Seq25_V]
MFTNKNFDLKKDVLNGEVSVISPSNIALVKYWGKHGNQLPCNPSISITLDDAHTRTTIQFAKKSSSGIDFDFSFEGAPNEKFKEKIAVFFEQITPLFPFLVNYHFTIDSLNTFPHSSGIASSASSMSALGLALVEIEKLLSLKLFEDEYYLSKASYVARLGSGSACRSLFPKMSVWGKAEGLSKSSDDYGISYLDFHPKFEGIHDSIAIVSKSEKVVSSRAGHALMQTHPFAEVRFANARNNLQMLLKALRDGEFDKFAEIVESEALELHGLMMNSSPSFILMEPNTLEAISRIRKFRAETGHNICFTLDAGPNVHILYLNENVEEIRSFLEKSIQPLCENEFILHDKMGEGSRSLNA